MKKTFKIIGKVLLWTIGVVVALVLALPLWIGPVVKTAANAIVPSKTGTGFNLGEFGLSQYSGRLTVGDMQLENPAGCSQKMAATLGKFHVDVDMGSVLSDTIVIEDVVIQDVFVSYVSDDKGENNFAIIQRNATGGKKAAEPAQEKAAPAPKESKPAEEGSGKKVIIDHLLIDKVVVQLGPVTLPLKMKIEMNGIGRKSSGVTFAEAWDEIYASVMKSFSDLGVNLNQLSAAGMDQAAKALEAAKAVNVKGMTDAIKGGSDLVSGATGKTVDALNKSTGKALDAVGESADKATKALKSLFN